jgi:hypothetical protein
MSKLAKKKEEVSQISRARKLAYLKEYMPMRFRSNLKTKELDELVKHIAFVNAVSGKGAPLV